MCVDTLKKLRARDKRIEVRACWMAPCIAVSAAISVQICLHTETCQLKEPLPPSRRHGRLEHQRESVVAQGQREDAGCGGMPYVQAQPQPRAGC